MIYIMDTFIEYMNKYFESTKLAQSTKKALMKSINKFARSVDEKILKIKNISRNQMLEYIQNIENTTKKKYYTK